MRGQSTAQFTLGYMYAYGEGVTVDGDEAVKWFRQAAMQGDVDAQYNLAVIYDNGEVVPENDVAAYAWYSVAAASGFADARAHRDAHKRKLTPSQLDQVQEIATKIFDQIQKRAE